MVVRRIRVVVASLEKFVDKIIRKLVLDIVANLQSVATTGYGTPVDTGWARANWVPQVGKRRGGTVGTREAAEAGQVDEGVSVLATARIATGYRFKQGPVFISNNVPYIVVLNDGSSDKAPRGFVQNAITKAVRTDLLQGLGAGA